jgi:hypothetical protein
MTPYVYDKQRAMAAIDARYAAYADDDNEDETVDFATARNERVAPEPEAKPEPEPEAEAEAEPDETRPKIQLAGMLEQNVIVALAWSDDIAEEVALKVRTATDFSIRMTKIIAEAALDYLTREGVPAKDHLIDLLEDEIVKGPEGRSVVEYLTQMREVAPNFNSGFVRRELDQFIATQRLVHAINQASDRLTGLQMRDLLLHDPAVDWDYPGNLAAAQATLRAALPPEEPLSAAPERKPPQLDKAALHGLAGEFVELVAPESEASQANLLFQFLPAFGNRVGRKPYFQIEGDRHRAVLYTCIVAPTGEGKGIGEGRVRQSFDHDGGALRDFANGELGTSRQWLRECVYSGALGSGEGLITRLRDHEDDMISANGEHQAERRLFFQMAEFATQLKIIERGGSTASPLLRHAWDCPEVLYPPLIKSSRERSTGAHVGVNSHITPDELQRCLTLTEIANGFGNRFVFAYCTRAQLLPMGGDLDRDDIRALAARIDAAARRASQFDEVDLDRQAAALWDDKYREIRRTRPGLLGALVARGAAQVRRLALIYALLDGRQQTAVAHLQAALAAWQYAYDSAAFIFGDAIGEPVADTILQALRQAGQRGLTRLQISNLLSRHQSSERIMQALKLLADGRYARVEQTTAGQRGGRPAEIWFAVEQR